MNYRGKYWPLTWPEPAVSWPTISSGFGPGVVNTAHLDQDILVRLVPLVLISCKRYDDSGITKKLSASVFSIHDLMLPMKFLLDNLTFKRKDPVMHEAESRRFFPVLLLTNNTILENCLRDFGKIQTISSRNFRNTLHISLQIRFLSLWWFKWHRRKTV